MFERFTTAARSVVPAAGLSPAATVIAALQRGAA